MPPPLQIKIHGLSINILKSCRPGGGEKNTFLFINSSLAHTSRLPLSLCFLIFLHLNRREIFRPTHKGLRGKRPLGRRGHCNWEEHMFVFLCEQMHACAHRIPSLPHPSFPHLHCARLTQISIFPLPDL